MKKEKNETGYTQLSLFELEDFKIEEAQARWSEGVFVKNICNNKIYTVKKDYGDIVRVTSKDSGYSTMCKSDLEEIK